MSTSKSPPNVDAYIAMQPAEVQEVLRRVRATLQRALPGASEAMSYGMPSLRQGDRSVLAYAGWRKHISIYPIPGGSAALQKQIEPYKAGRGTLRFPLDQPIPYPLIARVAKELLKASLARPARRKRS
jgi:uncharacterized protein YdhG (YjbR/CyaY superfamily)